MSIFQHSQSLCQIFGIGNLCRSSFLNFIELVVRRCSGEKVLKNSQNSQENICAGMFFRYSCRRLACNFIGEEPSTRVFPVNFTKCLRTLSLQNNSSQRRSHALVISDNFCFDNNTIYRFYTQIAIYKFRRSFEDLNLLSWF